MRCACYDCDNNEEGYCGIDSYVQITEEHECDSYYHNPYLYNEIKTRTVSK